MPQTLKEIRAMLQQAGLAPQKMFGQNFLIDQNLLRRLAELAEVGPGQTVLEVGPGTGTLTETLLHAGATVLAVEIDHGLADLLRSRLGDQPTLELYEGDILAGKHELNGEVLDRLGRAGTPVQMISNLPYNVATPVVCECLISALRASRGDAAAVPFRRLTFTVQKELTERFAAHVSDEAYGPVSVLVSLLGETIMGPIMPAEAFWPRPKVTSRMMRIDFRAPDLRTLPDIDILQQVLTTCFSQRRKMIGSAGKRKPANLLPHVTPERFSQALEQADIDPNLRPEDVGPEQFAALAVRLHKQTTT